MSFSSKNLRELNPWADLWWKHVVIAAADELDRLNAENARLREARPQIDYVIDSHGISHRSFILVYKNSAALAEQEKDQ